MTKADFNKLDDAAQYKAYEAAIAAEKLAQKAQEAAEDKLSAEVEAHNATKEKLTTAEAKVTELTADVEELNEFAASVEANKDTEPNIVKVGGVEYEFVAPALGVYNIGDKLWTAEIEEVEIPAAELKKYPKYVAAVIASGSGLFVEVEPSEDSE